MCVSGCHWLLLDVYIGFCVCVSGCHWTDGIGYYWMFYIGFACVCLAVIGLTLLVELVKVLRVRLKLAGIKTSEETDVHI